MVIIPHHKEPSILGLVDVDYIRIVIGAVSIVHGYERHLQALHQTLKWEKMAEKYIFVDKRADLGLKASI